MLSVQCEQSSTRLSVSVWLRQKIRHAEILLPRMLFSLHPQEKRSRCFVYCNLSFICSEVLFEISLVVFVKCWNSNYGIDGISASKPNSLTLHYKSFLFSSLVFNLFLQITNIFKRFCQQILWLFVNFKACRLSC